MASNGANFNCEEILKSMEQWRKALDNSNEPPEIDVTCLTWLLSELGFKLTCCEYDKVPSSFSTKTMTVELKCGVSGVKAKLEYQMSACKCPSTAETSLRELQAASQPKNKEAGINAAKSLSVVSKSILENLLKSYKVSLDEQQQNPQPEIQGGAKRKIQIPSIFDSPKVDAPRSSTAQPVTIRIERQDTFELKNEKTLVKTAENESQAPQTLLPNPSAEIKMELSPVGSIGSSLSSFDGQQATTSSPKESLEESERRLKIIKSLTSAQSSINFVLAELQVNLNVTQTITATTTKPINHSMQIVKQPIHRSNTQGVIGVTNAQGVHKPLLNRRSSFGFIQRPVGGSPGIQNISNPGTRTPRPLRAKHSITTPTPNVSPAEAMFSRPTLLRKSSKLASNAPSLIDRFKMQKTTPGKKDDSAPAKKK